MGAAAEPEPELTPSDPEGEDWFPLDDMIEQGFDPLEDREDDLRESFGGGKRHKRKSKKRKTKKRKSKKRKTHKRKSKKRKTHKRKTHKRKNTKRRRR